MTVLEGHLANLLDLQTSSDNGTTWITWFGKANSISVTRGGRPNGVASTVDVGTLNVTLINAGDPLTDSTLQVNQPIRLMLKGQATPYVAAVPVYTGRILDFASTYTLDKSSGITTTFVNIVANDAVRTHANTIRYGAYSTGGVGYETWAQRINRLATSATEAINPPADDSPIVRYAI